MHFFSWCSPSARVWHPNLFLGLSWIYSQPWGCRTGKLSVEFGGVRNSSAGFDLQKCQFSIAVTGRGKADHQRDGWLNWNSCSLLSNSLRGFQSCLYAGFLFVFLEKELLREPQFIIDSNEIVPVCCFLVKMLQTGRNLLPQLNSRDFREKVATVNIILFSL